ncbi:unnamed protein product [Laminaria digitata]
MMNACKRRCSHDSCTKRPAFNVKGSKTGDYSYCNQHAEDGVVGVLTRCCLHDSCTSIPTFNVEASKSATYCKQHARDGMTNIRGKRFSHNSCISRPGWGELTNCGATRCGQHGSDGLSNSIINYREMCMVAGCGRVSRWGLGGKQPTHCPDRGPLEDGLVGTLVTAQITRVTRSPSYRPLRGPSSHDKTECLFSNVLT